MTLERIMWISGVIFALAIVGAVLQFRACMDATVTVLDAACTDKCEGLHRGTVVPTKTVCICELPDGTRKQIDQLF